MGKFTQTYGEASPFAYVDLTDLDMGSDDMRVPCIVTNRFRDDDDADAPLVASITFEYEGVIARRMIPDGLLIDPSTLSAR